MFNWIQIENKSWNTNSRYSWSVTDQLRAPNPHTNASSHTSNQRDQMLKLKVTQFFS